MLAPVARTALRARKALRRKALRSHRTSPRGPSLAAMRQFTLGRCSRLKPRTAALDNPGKTFRQAGPGGESAWLSLFRLPRICATIPCRPATIPCLTHARTHGLIKPIIPCTGRQHEEILSHRKNARPPRAQRMAAKQAPVHKFWHLYACGGGLPDAGRGAAKARAG